jgi:DNA-3-methyladenine glycosylase I
MSARSTLRHADGISRCSWCGVEPIYVNYHDQEWGVPEWDDRALFEKLVLDGFQAGLSWITILRKRDAFRQAFNGFRPEVMARYDGRTIARLMENSAIVRNRAKIEASRTNARAWLAVQEREGFARFLWNFVDGRPQQNRFRSIRQIPAQTPLAVAISKELRARAFSFVGPTIVYAFMQAVGMVNDHLITCHRHETCVGLSPR